MHPFVVQQLAAEHVKELLAEADDARRARQARPARRPRKSWPGTSAEQARLEQPSAAITVPTAPANPPAQAGQDREPALADRGHARM
jgi:hypothetical protein